MIKLQFSRSTEIVSSLIALACKSQFSHVDAIIDGVGLLGASDSPKAPVIEGNPNGVAIRPFDYQPFAIRRIAHLHTTDAIEAKFYEVLRSQIGEPFDTAAMHAVFSSRPDTGRNWQDAGAWFCSEYKAWSLMQAGFFPFAPLISKDRVTPPDLLLMISFAVANAETFWMEPKDAVTSAA